MTDTATPIGEQNHLPDEHKPGDQRFEEADVRAGRRWRHYRGNVYTTIGIARESTNGPDEGKARVVYRGPAGNLCVRDAGQFLDGRFVPLD